MYKDGSHQQQTPFPHFLNLQCWKIVCVERRYVFIFLNRINFSVFIYFFQECSFNKLYIDTTLKVSYQGNIREYSHAKCNRWYFKFNGNECSGPMPIDSVLFNRWSSGIPSGILRPHFFEGFCENLPQGTVRVELWVGKCARIPLGEAYTGWNSVSRIMIEEVPPPQ